MIVVGSDHGGFELKKRVVEYLRKNNFPYVDKGTFNSDSVDYPDIAKIVTAEVKNSKENLGILICGTGIGICIAANKVKGIRAALVYSKETAALAKEHNNANVICFGGRTMEENQVIAMLEIFLNSNFEGGRHQKRINKITDLEK